MSGIEWQFAEQISGYNENENISEEFFSNADVLSEVAGVVRESIQNSLDEVTDSSKPVRMVFTVGTQTPEIANSYFETLHPHIEVTDIREIPVWTDPSLFLVIEDFNTRGLEGPTTPNAPTEQAVIDAKPIYKHSFWFFEWKTGGSDKGSGNRGSWGVGKIVFPRASRIKSHLVLSIRRAEASPNNDPSIMFGHSILKYRSIGDKRFVPDCQWMTKDGQNMSIPSSDASAQAQFIKDWKLTRQIGELGTSIVVPFCRESMNVKNLVQSIIRDYFISILGGQLVCAVGDDSGNTTEINKNTIVSLIEEEFGEENTSRRARSAAELITLCGMYEAHESGTTVKVAIPVNGSKANVWSEIMFAAEDADRITQAYNSGQTIELNVGTAVPEMVSPTKKEKSNDVFTVLLKKVMEMRGYTVFCREGILIPAANTASLLQNCVSMVIVGSMSSAGTVENSLANLLKNAEGPSHEKWSPSATKFKGRYKPKSSAEVVISWVKQSAERCLRLIQGAENLEDDTTLSPYFPFSNDDGSNPGAAKVVLMGRRDPGDPTRALIAWRADGFVPSGWVLKRLTPNEEDIEVGTEASGKTSTLLNLGDDAVYRFQMVMTNGGKLITSNIIVFSPVGRPIPPTPGPAKIEIKKLVKGFAIVAQNGKRLPDKYRFVVRAKYGSRGGRSPWTAEDFLLFDQMITANTKGLKIIESADNYVHFEITDPDIYAEWQGFDKLRDLDVTATEAF
jgi:hypothetical protein